MARLAGFLALAALFGLVGLTAPASAARLDADGPGGRIVDALSPAAPADSDRGARDNVRLAQGVERSIGAGGVRPRPRYPSWYRAGAYAGAAEAGAIIGADAVDDALDRPPPPDPACAFPSQAIGQLSAGAPPCNFCDNPPCN